MANRSGGQSKEYDHLFKLLIIGDSGKSKVGFFMDLFYRDSLHIQILIVLVVV